MAGYFKKKVNSVHINIGDWLMAGIQKAKRAETTQKLLDAATACVAEGGIDALHAREIARRSGYAVGSVYKYYADLDDVIIHINSRTLSQIRAAMVASIENVADPTDRLKRLAHSYLTFAQSHANLWQALFGHRLPAGMTIPDWHREENVALLGLIAAPLKEISPGLGMAALEARTRTCFAAVHGLVTISLEQRFISLCGPVLQQELDFLVTSLARPVPGDA